LEPWWGAWGPVLLAGIGTLASVGMLGIWAVLATFYCWIGRLAGYFGNRKLPLPASWRLAGAALLPGALFMTAAIILYGLGVLGLLQLVLAFVLHFVIGWVYLVVAPLRLPSVSGALPAGKNPFTRPQTADAATDRSSK